MDSESTPCLVEPTCAHVGTWAEALAHAAASHPLPRPTDREAWKRARRTLVGASEMAAVIGESPYATPLDVWVAKVHGVGVPETERMRIGLAVEPFLRADYAERHNTFVAPCVTKRHEAFAHGGATPDGEIADGRLMQIKNVSHRVARRDWTDSPPRHVLVQVQWELEVYDREESVIVALLGGEEIAEHRVTRDRDLGGMMFDLLVAFWERYVVTREPPPVGDDIPNREALLRAFPKPTVETLDACDVEAARLAFTYAAARAIEATAKHTKDQAAARLEAKIRDRLGFALPGGRVTWGARAGSTDWKALALALGATPGQAKEYARAPTRVLDVKLGDVGDAWTGDFAGRAAGALAQVEAGLTTPAVSDGEKGK